MLGNSISYVLQACSNLIRPRFTAIWGRVEPHYGVAKKVLIALVIAFNIAFISLCISAFLFGTVYFYHMPTIYHTFPLHFKYNRSCVQQHKLVEEGLRWDKHLMTTYTKRCYPVANVQLASPKKTKLLQEGQVYSVVVKLELPETPANLDIGMFMVSMNVEGYPVKPIANPGEYRWSRKYEQKNLPENVLFSSSRATSLRYKSQLLSLIYKVMFWPLLLFEFMHETQWVDEVLFDDLILQQKSLNWSASVFLEHPSIHVYSGQLDIVAQFSGIQYILYKWPVFSFVAGTAIFFLPVLFTVILIFYFCIWRPFFGSRTTSEPNRFRRRRRHRPNSTTLSGDESQPDEPTRTPSDVNSGLLNDSSNGGRTPETVGSGDAPVDAPTYSRRSSSSSIEMISQPPLFSSDNQSSFVLPTMSGREENGEDNVDVQAVHSDASLRQRRQE